MLSLIVKNLRGVAVAAAIFAPLCMVVEVFADLQQPRLMAEIIDIGVASRDLNYVLQAGGRMVLFAFTGLLGGIGCSVLATYASTRMAAALRQAQFQKVQSLSFGEIDTFETSSLITRLTNDVSQVQQLLGILLRGVRAPLLCIGGIVMAFLLSPDLALILCLSVPILALGVFSVISRTIPLYDKVQIELDNINAVMRENLLGIRVVKALTLEKRRFAHFTMVNKFLMGNSIRAQTMAFLLMPLVMLVMNLSVVAVLWFGGGMAVSGTLPAGKIMAFVNYMVQISNALVMLAASLVMVSRATASGRRILEVLAARPSVTEPQNPAYPADAGITFEDVSFCYPGGDCVLQDLSFAIPSGGKIGLIGATGSGKSTLAALIARLYDVTTGVVRVGGEDVRNIPLSTLRHMVGLVLQDSLLFSGTVAGNLRYGDESATDGQLWEALDAAQAEFVAELPEKLESRVEQRGTNFSGGQKQRLNIARTLLRKPEICILDDSASALDLATEARLRETVSRWTGPGTLLVVSQRISSLMDCDSILVLDGGKLAGHGPHRELLRESTLYRSIAVSQLGEEVLP